MVVTCLLVIKIIAYFCLGYLVGQWVSVLFDLPQLVSTAIATGLSVVAILIFEEQIQPKLHRLLVRHVI